jgi:tripartite-type tricarboxylate transporter receptor subunit TctC
MAITQKIRRRSITMKKALAILSIIASVVLSLANTSVAADYPNKPITLISPMPPGGMHDVVGRGFAAVAEKHLGQPVVVVNKQGAGGLVGGKAIAEATPDGYTIGVDSTTLANNSEWEIANGRKPPFTRQDFTLLGSLTLSPALVLVPFNSPWKTLADLIKDCKAKPGQYAYASAGMYGGTHIAAVILTRGLGIRVRHVPYEGGGQALSALVGEHVHFMTQYPPAAYSLVRGKKLRVLAVQGGTRLKSLPDAPTVRELGAEAAEYQQWYGVSAPKKMAAPIVEKLRDVVKKTASDESFVKMIENQGDEVRYMSSEELAKYRDIESERVSKLLKQLVEEKK